MSNNTLAPSARRAGSKHTPPCVPSVVYFHRYARYAALHHCSFTRARAKAWCLLMHAERLSLIIFLPLLNHCSSIIVLPSLVHWVITHEKRSLLPASSLFAAAFASALAVAAASLAAAAAAGAAASAAAALTAAPAKKRPKLKLSAKIVNASSLHHIVVSSG